MNRIIALDYGIIRTGIAVTDPLRIIATSLTTIESDAILSFLDSYFKNEKVDTIVIGDPKNLNGTPSEISEEVNAVIDKITVRFPAIKVIKVDERFTSKIATQAIRDSGINKKKRRDKSLVDKISAVVILQSYLDSIQK